MARPNKKQHKIPRIYLQGFTDSKGIIWVADQNFKLYPQKPENILTENDYFTIRFPNGGGTLDIETKYLNGIEGSYADIYREKINKQQLIDKSEKARMAIFVASMLERQPMSRRSLEKFFRDAEEKINHLRNLPERSKKAMALLPRSNNAQSISADEVLEAGKDVGSLHTSMIPKTISGIAPIIFDMQWCFFVRSSKSEPFITSDNPCTMVNPIAEAEYGRGTIGAAPGFVQKDVELTLPLSSNVALFCSWALKHDCLYVPVNQTLVNDVNTRTKRNSGVLIGSNEEMLKTVIDRVRTYHNKTHNKQKVDLVIGVGKLAGKGVYADRDFKKGEIVVKYNLKPLTKEEYKILPRSEKMFTHSQNGQIYLYSEPERYVNHSKTPNTYQDHITQADVALRDIKKGEMITTNATKDDI